VTFFSSLSISTFACFILITSKYNNIATNKVLSYIYISYQYDSLNFQHTSQLVSSWCNIFLISLHYSCKWMLKLSLSNLICLTTYLRVLFLFDNVLLLTLSKYKSYQRLFSVSILENSFWSFLRHYPHIQPNMEKVGFAITFLYMHHASIWLCG